MGFGYREQQSLKEFREEEAERERLEEERRLAPIREAEQQIHKTAKELFAIQKENIAKLRDDGLYVAPELVGARMSWEQAAAFNKTESLKFVQACPDYYPCEENHLALCDYFDRNGTNIINAPMWQAAFHKLDALGLMIHRPAPEAEPIRELEHIDPVQEQPRPNSMGHDLQTGQLREYTPWEVGQLTADEFRRAFNLRNIYGKTIDPATGREVQP